MGRQFFRIMMMLSVVLMTLVTGQIHADEGPEGQLAAAVVSGGILTAPRAAYADPDPSSMPGQPEDGEPLPSLDEALETEKEAQAGPEVEPEPYWFEKLIEGWKGEVRLGTDLSTGSVERTRFRGGFNINKSYDGHKTSLRTDYAYAETNNVESENRMVNGLTQDWGTGDTKFSGVFLRGTGELDEFRAYDYRLNLAGGGRYQIIKDDKTDSLLRIGVSATREFGSPREDWVPEGAFFLSVSHILTVKQKLTANIDYFPELENPDKYRVTAKATWDFKLDQENGLSLRIGAENRYDTRIDDANNRNDLDIRAELVWQF
ncbi:MAG: DUF481 domain-containing protein [Phycisphaerales bacterium JB058]